MYYCLELIKKNELFFKCWLAATNMKAFITSIYCDELLNINIALLCEKIQNSVHKNSSTEVPFNICAYLLVGAARIYREQVNILLEKTTCIYNLNLNYNSQRLSFFKNVNNKEANKKKLCELRTFSGLYDSDSDLDNETLETRLENLIIEGERQIASLKNINKKINISTEETENYCTNENIQTIDDENDLFGNLSNHDISNLVDILEGKKTFFDFSNNGERYSDVSSSIEPVRDINTTAEYENINTSLQELNINDLVMKDLSYDISPERNDNYQPFDVLQDISYQQNISNDELVPIASPDIVMQTERDYNVNDSSEGRIAAISRIIVPRRKRRRKQLKIDAETTIPSDKILQQFFDYENTLRCGPSETRKIASAVQIGEKYTCPSTVLFSSAGHQNLNKWQNKLFNSNLKTQHKRFDISIIDKILGIANNNIIDIIVEEGEEEETIENIDRYIRRTEIIDELNFGAETQTQLSIQQQNQQQQQQQQQQQLLTDSQLSSNLLPDIFHNDGASQIPVSEMFNIPKDSLDKLEPFEKIKIKINPSKIAANKAREKSIINVQNRDVSARENRKNDRTSKNSRTFWNEKTILNKLKILWITNKDQITFNKLCEKVDKITASKIFSMLLDLNIKNYIKLRKISDAYNGFYIEQGEKIF